MNRKTKADIERLANSFGATVEEDEGYRDMRVFQIVAPHGQLWVSGFVRCVRVEWATGKTPHAAQHNATEWAVLKQILECGIKPIPADQESFYAED